MIKSHLRSDWWEEAGYITRYAGSGVINTIVGFIIIFSIMALGFSPMVSNIAGYAVGFTMGFVLSKKFVFRSNGHVVAESVRYLVAFFISFLFNLLVLRFALNYLNLNAFVSQVIASMCYTLLMYILTRLFVFGIIRENEQALKNDAVVFYITFAMLFLNVVFFIIGKLGIGNDILGYMTGAGKFDDFYNLFGYASTIPSSDSPIQYTALAIIFGRIFDHHQIVGLIIILFFGVFPPIFLIKREILKYVDKNRLIYIFFILSSYPVLFALSRGNPTLIAVLWTISGVLAFISGDAFTSRSSLVIGSFFHPVPALFSVLFLKDGVMSFLKVGLLICVFQLVFYSILGNPLLETMTDVSLSLEKYKVDYIMGGKGDLYNNSLFFIIKIIFMDDISILNFALIFIPLFLLVVVILKAYAGYRIYGRNSALFMFGLYFVPIYLVISSPVSADYRLAYLLVPVVLMLLTRSFGLPFFLLLAALVPKHFVFFSSHWLNLHPEASLVYPDLIKTTGITLNSVLTPTLLLICILIPNSYIVKFTHKLLNKNEGSPQPC